uniref:Uncharacterized protein n=1 Tax=Onchocerca volvulus TaxID=6282 RepID=A0A8R1Y0F0_ONCVO
MIQPIILFSGKLLKMIELSLDLLNVGNSNNRIERTMEQDSIIVGRMNKTAVTLK